MAKTKQRTRKEYIPSDFGAAKLVETTAKSSRDPVMIRVADNSAVLFDGAEQAGRFRRARVLEQNNLDRLHTRHMIDDNEYHAGRRLARLWRRANYDRPVTMRWSDFVDFSSKAAGDVNVAIEQARQSLRLILDSLGKSQASVLYWFVIADLTAREAAAKTGYDFRHGLSVIRLALRTLDEAFAKLGLRQGI